MRSHLDRQETLTSLQHFWYSLAAKSRPGQIDASANSFALSCWLSFLVWDVILNPAPIPWLHRGQDGCQVRIQGVMFLGQFQKNNKDVLCRTAVTLLLIDAQPLSQSLRCLNLKWPSCPHVPACQAC